MHPKSAGGNLRRKSSCMLGLAGLLLSGCAGITHLSQLPPDESKYFSQKAETCLSKTSAIQEMTYVRWSGFQANITIRAERENAEADCRNLIRAISRDPNFPAIDTVNVMAKCIGSRQVEITVVPSITVVRPHRSDIYVPPITKEVTEAASITVFGCYITKDALWKGEEPIVDIRDGIYVSGNLKGSDVDW